MKKSYTVEITDEALSNMEQIYQYIAETLLSPENAIGQYNRIADAILTLDELPQRCPIMDTEPEHDRGIRRMLIDNYSVFYIVKRTRVIVTNVLYSASDIIHRLKNQDHDKT